VTTNIVTSKIPICNIIRFRHLAISRVIPCIIKLVNGKVSNFYIFIPTNNAFRSIFVFIFSFHFFWDHLNISSATTKLNFKENVFGSINDMVNPFKQLPHYQIYNVCIDQPPTLVSEGLCSTHTPFLAKFN
jgi:hypothetical protein